LTKLHIVDIISQFGGNAVKVVVKCTVFEVAQESQELAHHRQ
jgi:hypothetical protein